MLLLWRELGLEDPKNSQLERRVLASKHVCLHHGFPAILVQVPLMPEQTVLHEAKRSFNQRRKVLF